MLDKPLNIVVVGGSLAGLMHGIVLKRFGHNVHILNRELSSQLQSQGAGIGTTDSVREFCDAYDLLKGQPFWVTSPHIQFLTPEAKVKSTWNITMQMTTWNVLYYRLRANFDGLRSSYCPDTRQCTITGEGKAVYLDAHTVTAVNYDSGQVMVEYADMSSKKGILSADLVIAADGPGSTLRRALEPSVLLEYVGYVTFRGTVPESEISEATKAVFATKLTFYQMYRTHIIVYNIPGVNGNLHPGRRAYNYAWYANHPNGSPSFAALMTDTSGHRHRSTVPIGKLRPETWALQLTLAEKVLPGLFLELVRKTKHPFVQAISEAQASRATYFDGKLLLVGDALATFRPHAAASTSQAANSAMLLGKVMRGETTLRRWEASVMRYARVRGPLGKMLGARYQAGYGVLVVRFLQLAWAFVTQYLVGLVFERVLY